MKDIIIKIKTNSTGKLKDRLNAFERKFMNLKNMSKITLKAIKKKDQEIKTNK